MVYGVEGFSGEQGRPKNEKVNFSQGRKTEKELLIELPDAKLEVTEVTGESKENGLKLAGNMMMSALSNLPSIVVIRSLAKFPWNFVPSANANERDESLVDTRYSMDGQDQNSAVITDFDGTVTSSRLVTESESVDDWFDGNEGEEESAIEHAESAVQNSKTEVRNLLIDLQNKYVSNNFVITAENIESVRFDVLSTRLILESHNETFPNDAMRAINIAAVQAKIDSYLELQDQQLEPTDGEVEVISESIVHKSTRRDIDPNPIVAYSPEQQVEPEVSRSDLRDRISDLGRKYLASGIEITNENYGDIFDQAINAHEMLDTYNLANPENTILPTVLNEIHTKLTNFKLANQETESISEISRSQVINAFSDLQNKYLSSDFFLSTENYSQVVTDYNSAVDLLQAYNLSNPNSKYPDTTLAQIRDKIDAYNQSLVQAEPVSEQTETFEENSRSDVREALSNLHTKYLAEPFEITEDNYNQIVRDFAKGVVKIDKYNFANPDNKFPNTVLVELQKKIDKYENSKEQARADLEPIPADVFDASAETEVPVIEPATSRATKVRETTYYTENPATMAPVMEEGEKQFNTINGEQILERTRSTDTVIPPDTVQKVTGVDLNLLKSGDYFAIEDFFVQAYGSEKAQGMWFEDFDNTREKDGETYYQVSKLNQNSGQKEFFYISLDGTELV